MLVFAFAASYVLAKALDLTMGFRGDEEQEVDGIIDQVLHAETAYDLHANAGGRSAGTVLVGSPISSMERNVEG